MLMFSGHRAGPQGEVMAEGNKTKGYYSQTTNE